MAQQDLSLPPYVGDGLRKSFDSIQANFDELYAAGGGGSSSLGIVTETTTSRTLQLTDAQKYLRCTNASAVSVTVPPQSSVEWDDGAEIIIEQAGAGQVTIVAGSGVTIRNKSDMTLKTAAQYSVVTLKRVAENEWVMGGDREAA